MLTIIPPTILCFLTITDQSMPRDNYIIKAYLLNIPSPVRVLEFALGPHFLKSGAQVPNLIISPDICPKDDTVMKYRDNAAMLSKMDSSSNMSVESLQHGDCYRASPRIFLASTVTKEE